MTTRGSGAQQASPAIGNLSFLGELSEQLPDLRMGLLRRVCLACSAYMYEFQEPVSSNKKINEFNHQDSARLRSMKEKAKRHNRSPTIVETW